MGSLAILAFALAFLWKALGKLDAEGYRRQAPRLSPKGGFPLVVLVRFLLHSFSLVNLLENPFCPFPAWRKTARIALRSPITSVRWAWKARIWIRRSLRSLFTEMSQLNVQDAMVPRNQVQVLDDHDSLEKNMEIARTCGHTRLPLCIGDLDHCLGIIHVNYAFRLLSEGATIDLQSLAKAPAMLSKDATLPVALRKMMKWKVHMALVRDEFGGIDGVITLEDILEEVVGEIQDEFDADEHAVETLEEGKWRVPGLTPVHELPDELKLDENGNEDELTSFGGFVTRELGRIPEKGETVRLQHLKVTILEADDTRVLSAEATLAEEQPGTQEG